MTRVSMFVYVKLAIYFHPFHAAQHTRSTVPTRKLNIPIPTQNSYQVMLGAPISLPSWLYGTDNTPTRPSRPWAYTRNVTHSRAATGTELGALHRYRCQPCLIHPHEFTDFIPT